MPGTFVARATSAWGPRDRARYADDRAVDLGAREARRLDQRLAEHVDRVERRDAVGAGDLDVLARSDRALEIADRATKEACAEV